MNANHLLEKLAEHVPVQFSSLHRKLDEVKGKGFKRELMKDGMKKYLRDLRDAYAKFQDLTLIIESNYVSQLSKSDILRLRREEKKFRDKLSIMLNFVTNAISYRSTMDQAIDDFADAIDDLLDIPRNKR